MTDELREQRVHELTRSTPEPHCDDADDADDGRRLTSTPIVDAHRADADSGKPSIADLLVDLAQAAEIELFHDPDLTAYASFRRDGHLETWPLCGKAFRRYLTHLYYSAKGRTANAAAVTDAIATLEGRALFAGQTTPVHLRVAGDDQIIYLDLGDANWTAVEITPAGWRLITDPPVRFRRAAGMAPLPVPTRGGRLESLRRFANLTTDDDWVLLVAWLVGALRAPGQPYPLLALHGEQGSAKSTTARLIRDLIDPSTAPLRAAPQGVRDLMIAANAGWVLSYDNLSHIPQWFSDALCRLATGGGFATRELYSNDDERIFDAQRPVILTGIEELVTRGDLLDRTILLTLPIIPTHHRKDERTLTQEWHHARPGILGALLDAVSAALRDIDTTTLPDPPRMADFALWATAAEHRLDWLPGTFIRAYQANRTEGDHIAIAANPIGSAVLRLADKGFHGTATHLLEQLGHLTDDTDQRHRGWPRTPRTASGQLRRLAPNLRNLSIHIHFDRTPTARTITIRKESTATQHTTARSTDPREASDNDVDVIPISGDPPF